MELGGLESHLCSVQTLQLSSSMYWKCCVSYGEPQALGEVVIALRGSYFYL